MKIYRLVAIVSFLSAGAISSTSASAQTANTQGFTVEHSATPTLTSMQQPDNRNAPLSRQDVKRELVRARENGDIARLNSTTYFGSH